MNKDIKKQITEVLKGYKDMNYKLEVLHEKLNTTLDEREEIRILNTINVITRDKDIIDRTLASLKDRHREAFKLKFVQGHNAEKAGKIMCCDRSNVYRYIDQIIDKIYELILLERG